MIKELYRCYLALSKKQNIRLIKFNISEEYDPLIKNIKTNNFEEWETSFFAEKLTESMAIDNPYQIISEYMEEYFKAKGYDSMELVNKVMIKHKYEYLLL